MGIAFASAIASGLDAHQARILPVLHIAFQHAVLDQHGAAGRGAFIIKAQGAAAIGDRAVINDRHAPGGDLLAHLAGEGGRALAVEIALQAVTHRFVQQDGRPARAKHDLPFARRRINGFEIDLGDPQRFVGEPFPGARRDPLIKGGATAGPGRAGFAAALALTGDGHIHAHERTHFGADIAACADNADHPARGGDGSGYLDHFGVLGAQIGVDLGEQGGFRLETRLGDDVHILVKGLIGAGRGGRHHRIAALTGGAGGFTGALERSEGRVRGMGEAGRLAEHAPQTKAALGVEIGDLQPAIVEGEAL